MARAGWFTRKWRSFLALSKKGPIFRFVVWVLRLVLRGTLDGPPAPPRRSCSRPGARGPTSTPS